MRMRISVRVPQVLFFFLRPSTFLRAFTTDCISELFPSFFVYMHIHIASQSSILSCIYIHSSSAFTHTNHIHSSHTYTLH
ncbi:hypothetical protein B0H16DRAFT_1576323, partial [Mycena metata]